MKAPQITPEVLDALGIDKDELRQQVLDAVVARVMGDGQYFENDFVKAVREKVDAEVSRRFAKMVGPITKAMVEKVNFPSTNKYGEVKGEPLTLREHVEARAKTYLSELVDDRGRADWEGGDSYSRKTSRLVRLVHEHLKYTLDATATTMVKAANEQIQGGIEAAIKATLTNITKNIKVNVAVKS